jgi:death on curing protein
VTDVARIEPIWLDAEIALAIHDRQLAEHGGISGLRAHDMLESVLARPVNKWVCGDNDLCGLAASYAYGVARNHPFGHGNKRTAWVLARLFLKLNGVEIVFDQNEAIAIVLALAAGELSEEELTDWFRFHIKAA